MTERTRAIRFAIVASVLMLAAATVSTLVQREPAAAFATNDLRIFIQCGTSGIPSYNAQVDPIVSPNQFSMHMHTFLGSTRITSDPDYNRIVAGPLASNCDTRRDTAGYWVPQARNILTGQLISAQRMNVYYVNPSKSAAMVPFPPDFQAVSNDIEILAPGGTVEAGAGVRVWFRRQCWDGTLHMTSPEQYVAHTRTGTNCPAGWSLLPKLHFNARFGIGSMAGWEAAAMTGWHGDFWNTWHQPSLNALTVACLRPRPGAGCGRVTDANFASILTSRGVAVPPVPTESPSPSPSPTQTPSPSPSTDPAVQALLDAYNALSPEQQAAFLVAVGA